MKTEEMYIFKKVFTKTSGKISPLFLTGALRVSLICVSLLLFAPLETLGAFLTSPTGKHIQCSSFQHLGQTGWIICC